MNAPKLEQRHFEALQRSADLIRFKGEDLADREMGQVLEATAAALYEIPAILRELQAAAERAVVPDGWKLVPIVPTEDMRWAATQIYDEESATVSNMWAYMLNAAPQPGEVAG